MRVRVLVEMDDGGRGVRAVNALDSAMRDHNEKLRRANPSAQIDFEVLGVVPETNGGAGRCTAHHESNPWWHEGAVRPPSRVGWGVQNPTGAPEGFCLELNPDSAYCQNRDCYLPIRGA